MNLYQAHPDFKPPTPVSGMIPDDSVMGVFLPVESKGPVLWCFTHYRIPEDGVDLCGDEWREIGPCDFGRALIVRESIRGAR